MNTPGARKFASRAGSLRVAPPTAAKTLCLVVFCVFCILAIGPATLPNAVLQARGASGYARVLKILPELWAKKYPVRPVKFTPNPGGKGYLRATHKGRRVYYYRFRVTLPLPVRNPEGIPEVKSTRELEFWVRHRPHEKKTPFDLTFARQDLLPGSGKRWVKSK